MLGSALKSLRLAGGWPVEDLAERLEVTGQTIRNWEAGITEPKVSQFARFCWVTRANPISLLRLAWPRPETDSKAN